MLVSEIPPEHCHCCAQPMPGFATEAEGNLQKPLVVACEGQLQSVLLDCYRIIVHYKAKQLINPSKVESILYRLQLILNRSCDHTELNEFLKS